VIPVSVRGITKTFGPVRALDDVSLDIDRGELFFLLGPSGCGKTTLLRTIAGFYAPDHGQILFGPTDVTATPPQRRNTGMVFQNYALWPHMTVEANVAFGLRVRGIARPERRRRVGEALDLVKMGPYAKRKPNQLSGGQQQRVALARALVIRPQCLLLDEPLSNLDAKLRLEMRGEIRRLCKDSGLTGIYVTHDQKEALSVADRMAVMFDGRIGQVGPPRALYRRPDNAAIAGFLGETNFIPATIVACKAEDSILETPLGRIQARSDPGGPRAGRVIASIRPEALLVGEAGHPSTAPRKAAADVPVSAVAGASLPNAFAARVIDVVYLGEAVQLILAADDVRLVATVTERSINEAPRPGSAVTCGVAPEDVVLLPESSALV
jgi:iron(III) transport system ATP-binding protein